MPDNLVLDGFAREWIAERALKLATLINGTTMKDILATLQPGYELGETIPQLSKRIEMYFADSEKWRAAMVARTEIIAANNEAILHRLETNGVEKSEFYASPDACPQCTPYVGIYPTRESHGMIPVHPNCKCRWFGVIGSRLDSPDVSAAMSEQYSSLRSQTNADGNEHMRIVDSNGNTLFEKTGTAESVQITTEDINVLKANKHSRDIHTHLTDGSLSIDDVIVAMKYNIENMEVVTPHYVAKLKAPIGGYLPLGEIEQMVVKNDYMKLLNDLKPKWVSAHLGGMPAQEASQNLSHEIISRLSKQHNLNYTRELK